MNGWREMARKYARMLVRGHYLFQNDGIYFLQFTF